MSAAVGSFCAMAAMVVLIGVGGLQQGAHYAFIAPHFSGVSLLFGIALCGLVLARFYWRMRFGGPFEAVDIRRFSRHSSRIVFLLVYLVLGATQVLSMLGGTGMAESRGTLQGYLVCTLAALVLIRILAAISLRIAGGPLRG